MILTKTEVHLDHKNKEIVIVLYHDFELKQEMVEEWTQKTDDMHPENLRRFLMKKVQRTVFTESGLKKFMRKVKKLRQIRSSFLTRP